MWTIIFFTYWQCSSFVMGNDDWLSDPSDESQPKCEKSPPKSSKNEILLFILRSTSADWPSDPSNKSQPKCKKGPLSHQKLKCSFLDYIQLLMIGWVIWVMKVDQNVKDEMLFQLGSSVVSVWVFCMPPPSPPLDGKIGITITKKFWFFTFTFNKFQPKDNSVQSLLHLLAMQLICDGQCTNCFTLHFYNL